MAGAANRLIARLRLLRPGAATASTNLIAARIFDIVPRNSTMTQFSCSRSGVSHGAQVSIAPSAACRARPSPTLPVPPRK